MEVEAGRACAWLLHHSPVASRSCTQDLSEAGPRIPELYCCLLGHVQDLSESPAGCSLALQESQPCFSCGTLLVTWP